MRAAIDQLRDPATSADDAEALAASTPAILLVQANVHGGEESGTEASLRLLYELADRTDCVSDTILDNAIVVILPVQNPDGREADTRRNAYDIDMNRDWFARTQPETDAKLELYRQLPPVLDLDVHEMGAFTYFFPPNSDPVYHEIADTRTTGSTASTRRRWRPSSTGSGSATSTTSRTTSSARSTGTRCRPSRSTRPG